MRQLLFLTMVAMAAAAVAESCRAAVSEGVLPVDDGYRGIWYYNQPSKDEYKYKYSGGLATYPQQHVPIAIYSGEANKTFFVYGGRPKEKNELLHMVSYFDHATGLVPRPRILLNKRTDDAHENPVLALDGEGRLWIFSPAHGSRGQSFIHVSRRPYDITSFERTYEGNFSYPQPWHIPGKGFLLLHTRYGAGREVGMKGQRILHWMTSPDGRKWSEPQVLAGIAMGDYQISWHDGRGRVATAMDYHPAPLVVNARANIYYLETRDFGQSWHNVRGETVATPLRDRVNPALVYDSEADGLLVYLKDLAFDAEGRPIILFLTSRGYESGPKNAPRTWRTARWTGKDWEFRAVTTSDNNYDHGSLYVEEGGAWRIIAPTTSGPQAYNPGGEMVMWLSRNHGAAWEKVKDLTSRSTRNHTYARRPLNAHPDFYALWADGNAREPSESCLYFTNRTGDRVWRLPPAMSDEFARPEAAW